MSLIRSTIAIKRNLIMALGANSAHVICITWDFSPSNKSSIMKSILNNLSSSLKYCGYIGAKRWALGAKCDITRLLRCETRHYPSRNFIVNLCTICTISL